MTKSSKLEPVMEPGELVGSRDAALFSEDMLPHDKQPDVHDLDPIGNALYSYKFENKLNGIVVAAQDQKLPIDREDLLNVAFRLKSVEKSWVFWMSPSHQEECEKYAELLNQANEGRVRIVEEIKQYDAAEHAFMVWIRYYVCEYELHPRFEYLRKEQ